MRMRITQLCSLVLIGVFTISSSTLSPSNLDLYLGFLSYDDSSSTEDSITICCSGPLDECNGICQLEFDVFMRDRNGFEIFGRQHLATALSIKERSEGNTQYLDANDFTKPVSLDVPGQMTEVHLYIRIYRNVTVDDRNGIASLRRQMLDELVHVLDIGDMTDFFYKLEINGKQRSNSTLHLAVRGSCSGMDCRVDCVQRPWLPRCLVLQERKDDSKQKYIGNPFARCPYPSILPPVKPTSSSSPSPQQSTASTINTISATRVSSTSSISSKSLLPSSLSSPSSSPPSSLLTKTSFSTTSKSTPYSTPQTNEKTSKTSHPQSTNTNTLSSAVTESSKSQTLTVPSMQTTISQSKSTKFGSSIPSIEAPTQTVTNQLHTTMFSSFLYHSSPFHQSSTFIPESSSSTINSHQTEIHPTKTTTESSTNQVHSTSGNISPTSSRKSCACTKSKSQNILSSFTISVSSSMSNTKVLQTSSPAISSSSHNTFLTHKITQTQELTPIATTSIQKQTTIMVTSTIQPTEASSTTSTQGISSSTLPINPNTDIPTPPPKPTSKEGSSRTTTYGTKSTHESPQSSQPSTSPQTTQSPFLPVESSEDNDDAMAYWAIIVGSVLGGLALVGIIGYLLYRSRQTSLRKRQELYTVTPQMISTIEENGMAGRSDVPMTTALL